MPGLIDLNAMSVEEVAGNFLKCCGSVNWARQMPESRPFQTQQQLFDTADRVWRRLSEADWLEAFHGHPQIGEKTAEKTASAAHAGEARGWGAGEQCAT